MKLSLATRLSRTLFLFIAINTALSLFVIHLFVEDVESTILDLELQEDARFFIEQLQAGNFAPIKTARLEAIFLPEGNSGEQLPSYFQQHPVPFSLEVEIADTTLLVYGIQIEQPSGRLFLSQDITIMENRELQTQLVLFGLAFFILLVGYITARLGAQYLVHSFKKLTRDVLNTIPGTSMRKITTNYKAQEFSDIAEAFNLFLTVLENHIEREKSFIKLASHELRTPLAVISGALNVLDQRQTLTAADKKTLNRIRRAMHTMRDDTEILLELVRSEVSTADARSVLLIDILTNTINDLEQAFPEHRGRISVDKPHSELRAETHPALVRMLLRNLLQNALRHTHGAVRVKIQENRVLVRDFGTGLPNSVTEHLNLNQAVPTSSSRAGEFSNTTFGLLIVRMVCERLGWKLELTQSDNKGTEFVIHVIN